MRYEEAVNSIFVSYGADIFACPFLAYSRLLDLVGSSLYDNRLAGILFEVCKRIDVVSSCSSSSLIDIRRKIGEDYAAYQYGCSKTDLVSALNPLLKLLKPNEFTTKSNQKVVRSGAVCVKKAAPIEQNVISPSPVLTVKAKGVKSKKSIVRKSFTVSGSFSSCCFVSGPSFLIYDKKTGADLSKSVTDYSYGSYYSDYSNRDIVVSLPKGMEDLNFFGFGNVSFLGQGKGKFDSVKRIYAGENFSYLDANVECDSFYAQSNYGNMKVVGKADYLDLSSKSGNIDVSLVSSKQSSNVTIKSKSGNISFVDPDIRGPISKKHVFLGAGQKCKGHFANNYGCYYLKTLSGNLRVAKHKR